MSEPGAFRHVDSILELRDMLGFDIHKVHYVTREWNGSRVGDGDFDDDSIEIKPTPQLVQYTHNLRLTEAGAIKQGDILLRGISKHRYPDEYMINGYSSDPLIEKFYRIDDRDYVVISVKENYVTWDIQVRKTTRQTGEERERKEHGFKSS